MDTTLARPPIGQVLDGRYRVESHLANGGMATVYLGTDTRLDRAVALKIMHAELANDQDFVRRFVSEARSVAKLSHPNVVTVFDQGADGRTLFLAMEYVPGRTLRELLRDRGLLGPREALDIMDGVLGGLAAAHAAGIAHRDVKPENVLIGDGRTVKVADFGLARLVSGASHTQSGMIIGTAAYLAPEQVLGRPTDARTDVYAAGVLLFELLTGRQPHTGATPLGVAYKHVNEVVPPPSSIVPGLPPALDALVALATSRDPDLRPADAGQFLHAITEVRSGLPISASQAARPGEAAVPPFSPSQAAGAGEAAAWPFGRHEPVAGTAVPSPSPTAATIPPMQVPAQAAFPPAGAAPAGFGTQGAGPEGAGAPGSGSPGSGSPGSGGAGLAAAAGTARTEPPALGRVIPAGSWPDPPPGGPGETSRDLIPGLSGPGPAQTPGRWDQPGAWHPGGDVTASTRRFGRDDPYSPGDNKTLVVSAGAGNGLPAIAEPRYLAPREPRLHRLLFSRRLGFLALGLAVVLVIGLLGWWVLEGRYTTVPKVTGLATATATSDLQDAGLTVTTGKKLLDNQVAKGMVISTIPATGARISRGGKVTLIVSAGPHMIAMPQVTGQSLDAARAAIQHAGLVMGKITKETSATIPAGVVISSHPGPGTSWPQPQPVSLAVSAGPPMPNFVGQQKSAAEGWAGASHVQLNEKTANHSDQPAGTIIRQSVKPGAAFYPNQVITIVISAGPPMVPIPNVDGMPVAQAERVLARAGFQATVDRLGPLDIVFNYSPNGQAPKGSTITLQVGFPKFGG
jgi:eukaryotic-like serine/threonine-protein kinase